MNGKHRGGVVRITGKAPVQATLYELQKLRCNLCGEIFTAEMPDGSSGQKYDETARAMIALLKYGSGVPFYRLGQLQESLGIPLPAATQWDKIEEAADRIHPVFEELKRQAAQGSVVYNDDTTMRILDLIKDNRRQRSDERKGIFTTGILSTSDDRKIALFLTGRKHAGENLASVLEKRDSRKDPPIQMCDALSRNRPDDFETIMANCMAHARRNYVDVMWNFPDECRYVIELLGKVYQNL